MKFETICVTPIDFESSNKIQNKQYDVYSSPAVCVCVCVLYSTD